MDGHPFVKKPRVLIGDSETHKRDEGADENSEGGHVGGDVLEVDRKTFDGDVSSREA